MTLEPLTLDDLDWATMVEAIRRRIPAESDGAWTLHAPVDPGITLLELFAYLLEQRLFWLDQVPDTLVVGMLRLLGLPGPGPARSAGTVLRLRAGQPGQPGQPPPTVPAGSVFVRDSQQPVTFTTDAATTVLPVDGTGIRIWAGGRERTADLVAQRPVPLLAPGSAPAQARILLPLNDPGQVPAPAGSVPAPAKPAADRRPPPGSTLSLLVSVQAPVASPPGWHPDAVDVPPPARLVWSWYQPDQADPSTGPELSPADPAAVQDGTLGLRRPGVLRLPLPAQWCAGSPDPAPTAYGIRLGTAAATYSVAPLLLALVPNTVSARHRRRLRLDGSSTIMARQVGRWRRMPGQHLDLPDAGGSLLAAELSITRDGVERQWTAAADRTAAGPDTPIFLLDRTAGAIRFGDGLNGAIPVPDAAEQGPALVVDYEVGGGLAGNGGLTANWSQVIDGEVPSGAGGQDTAPVASAENVVPAEGGTDPETMAGVRARIGDSLAEVTRAVTVTDCVDLVTTTPGLAIARCYVGVGEHPRYPCAVVPGAVTVRVVPGVASAEDRLTGDGYDPALQPDPGALEAVSRRLAPARLLGTELSVRPPRYRPVTLQVQLSGTPATLAAVRDTVRVTLRRYLDPLLGGDGGNGWPFGEPLRPSALLRATQAALGDLAVVEQVTIGVDGAAPSGGCEDVPIGSGWLPALGQVRVSTVTASGGGVLA